jgi:hypothetical protein
MAEISLASCDTALRRKKRVTTKLLKETYFAILGGNKTR